MEKKKEHSFNTRRRAFAIWQKLGYLPWRKKEKEKTRKSSGDFYRGAFDSIPFLNDDAKRTFVQLLLRPGYMIRDYIKGAHERYLAPLTALIIFYAFFALVSALLQPYENAKKTRADIENLQIEVDNPEAEGIVTLTKNAVAVLQKGWIYLNLDRYPEEVDTQHEATIAALEGTLRSQGIPLFIGQFLLLWLAMSLALRRYKLRMSAYAAASAYILCQFSFFMLFALLFSFGKSAEISVFLMLILLMLDYHQWLGTDFRKSFRLALKTGIHYGLLFVIVIILVAGAAFLIARSRA